MFGAATAEWVKSVLGAGVMSVGEVGTGLSSQVLRVELIDNRSVVLRLRPEAELVAAEAEALRELAGHGLPVPELLGVDAAGASAGAPAVLMSWLPGQAGAGPVAASARLLADVHSATRAEGTVLVHGAFGPGRVLWAGGEPTALLDWSRAHRGDPAEDVEAGAALLGEGFRAAYDLASDRRR